MQRYNNYTLIQNDLYAFTKYKLLLFQNGHYKYVFTPKIPIHHIFTLDEGLNSGKDFSEHIQI